MSPALTVFVDANVFYGARLRSLVLYCAQNGLFRARWSARIHAEWVGNLLRSRPDLRAEDLSATVEAMNDAVPDCLVSGYEALEAGLQLPDPDDSHVVAAAVSAGADVILTFNLKDFPKAVLDPLKLRAVHPDDFLTNLHALSLQRFSKAASEDFGHYKRPPLKFDAYLAALERAGVPKTAQLLRIMGERAITPSAT